MKQYEQTVPVATRMIPLPCSALAGQNLLAEPVCPWSSAAGCGTPTNQEAVGRRPQAQITTWKLDKGQLTWYARLTNVSSAWGSDRGLRASGVSLCHC